MLRKLSWNTFSTPTLASLLIASSLVGVSGGCSQGSVNDHSPVSSGKADDATAQGSYLPDPNASEAPPADWLPPPIAEWPGAYVIFNNTGCGFGCTKDDQAALKSRSVMMKMIVAAIHNVREDGMIRVSNFNISSSSGVTPVADALLWAISVRKAEVRIAMDSAQNTPDSRSTKLAEKGASVRFVQGMTYKGYQDGQEVDKVGIEHSKMVIVDDQVLLTGSNNFSSSGFITNEENSLVLTSAAHADRIQAFTCDFEAMFAAGTKPGEQPIADDDPTRHEALLGIDKCNTENTWFPPSGAAATDGKRSYTYDAVRNAIANARASIDLAPDMLAHPGLVDSILRRVRKAKEAEEPFRVRLALDGSSEALGNPAFAECFSQPAADEGLDIQIHYWPGNEEIFQLLHHKFMLIDAGTPDAALYNGSANYSSKALKWSFENVARYQGQDFAGVVDAFAARFESIFAAAKTKEQLQEENGIEAPGCPLD